ncbi:hypothetical protein GQ43DRAFT_440918 [Delitschia confertaspora ATCC 74209]|uniref:Uncharacterized protein n=1 Tax=Delitschia confertaspora ATCC 74209 TaxID=1513339 RepID=A0A9P4MYP7_9PLEO|nr:hypothetical protein GQ43DRAFT_440918 [Delitschia confertaspora ATCC 74209]
MSSIRNSSRSPPVQPPRPSPSPAAPLTLNPSQNETQNLPPDDTHDEEDEYPYPEPTSEAPLLPPPNFSPFFTIIEDQTTGEHYHPYVHYLFADDDPGIVTAAAMRSLGVDDTAYIPKNTEEEQNEEEEEGRGQDNFPLPPATNGISDRYILIDVATDGQTVVDAQSLSSEWQVSNTFVRPAPSFDSEPGDQGLMIKIEGVEIPSRSKRKEKGVPGEERFKAIREGVSGDAFKAMESIVKEVEEGVSVARRIAGAGRGESTIRAEVQQQGDTKAES